MRSLHANQGLLLAGAVAYRAPLSIVPLRILTLIVLSQVVDPVELLHAVGRDLEWLVPGQSAAFVPELARFFEHRHVVGLMLLASKLFFSLLATSSAKSSCWRRFTW